MKFLLLLIGLAASLGAGSVATRPAEFLMIGDWGRDPVRQPALHAQQRQVADGMSRFAGGLARPVTAVLALGDNQYDGVPKAEDPVFRTGFEEVYAAPGLQVPFWAVLGNHEYFGSPQGQLDYAARKLGTGRWVLPARYWSKVVTLGDGSKAKFVFLDTSVFIRKYREKEGFSDIAKQDPAAQLAWLDKELAGPGIAWRIAVGHHPIWSNGLHGDSEDMARDVLPILRRHKVPLYLSGHDHHPEVIRKGPGDPLQVVAGHASEVRGLKGDRDALHQGQYLGFGSLSLDGAKEATVRLHDATGAVRYEVRVGK
jgi:acid phosphatase